MAWSPPVLKELISNPLEAHNKQRRKLRSENKGTSEATQPVAEPGLESKSPPSFWSRPVTLYSIVLLKWSADCVDQPGANESQDRGSFCPLTF